MMSVLQLPQDLKSMSNLLQDPLQLRSAVLAQDHNVSQYVLPPSNVLKSMFNVLNHQHLLKYAVLALVLREFKSVLLNLNVLKYKYFQQDSQVL